MDEAVAQAQGREVTVLQEVVRAVDHGGRAGQARDLEAARKVPGHERRTGQRAVTHRPQGQTACAGHWPFAATQARRHFAGAHAPQADVLVLHHQVQQHLLAGAEIAHCTCPPGGQAVGIQRNTQALRDALLVQCRHLTLQVALEQAHLLDMVEQLPPDLGRAWRRGAHQHRLADPRLEQFDALRHRRLRQAQHLCGPLEPTLLDDGRQCGEQFVVEHRFH